MYNLQKKIFNIIRRSFFDLIEIMPTLPAKKISQIIVYLQSRVFISEIKKLIQESPCERSVNKSNIENILIIRLDAIGDIVWTTPFIHSLRDNYPLARIDMVVRPIAKTVLENCPYLDHIYTYDCPLGEADRQESIAKKKERAQNYMLQINKTRYDIVFLPREIFLGNSFDNLLLAAYSTCKHRIGRTYATNYLESVRADIIKDFFSEISLMTSPEHEAIQILREITLLGKKYTHSKMELWLSKDEKEYLTSWKKEHCIDQNDILIGVGLEGSSPNRSWKLENYIKVFESLQMIDGRYIRFILLGTKDLPQKHIESLMRQKHVINMSGKTTLRQVISILSGIDIYLGSDTGIMHVSAAFNKPIVEISAHFKDGRIMDSGSATLVGPWGVKNIVLEPESGLDGCIGWCTHNRSYCINQIHSSDVRKALEHMIRG